MNDDLYGGARPPMDTLETVNASRALAGLPPLTLADYRLYVVGPPGLTFDDDAAEWDAETEYVARDAVVDSGSLYRAKRDTVGERPSESPGAWLIVVQGVDLEFAEQTKAEVEQLGDQKVAEAAEQVEAADDARQAAQAAQAAAETARAGAEAARNAAQVSAANAQASALTCATWAVLSGLTGATAGTGAEVLDSDTGTHTDPVVGGTVSNAGRYSWSASPAGWQRIGNTGLSGKVDKAEISADAGLSVVIVDQNDTPTWLEAGLDGEPTPRVGRLVGPQIDRLGGAPLSADTGLSFVLTADDSAGRECVTDLEFRDDGRFSDRAIRSIAERFEASDFAAALDGYQPVSGPDICCLGDSLTAGAGGTPYPTVLASLSGRTVYNLGVGGETSRTITARVGGRPMLATVSGGSIPASGGVTVTLAGDDGAVAPLLQGDGGINPCSISGVVGTLSQASGVYTFTRATAGGAVAVGFPAPVITAAFTDRANDIMIIEMGQNDGTNDATDIIARVQAIIEWMAPLKKRWLIGGLSTVNAEYRAPYEAQMRRAFGRRFVNNREWLSSQACQDYLGLTPDAGHLAEMASGAVPANIRSDATHLNSLGYQAKAYFYFQRLTELGILEG